MYLLHVYVAYWGRCLKDMTVSYEFSAATSTGCGNVPAAVTGDFLLAALHERPPFPAHMPCFGVDVVFDSARFMMLH
jgi:hypothetical protein